MKKWIANDADDAGRGRQHLWDSICPFRLLVCMQAAAARRVTARSAASKRSRVLLRRGLGYRVPLHKLEGDMRVLKGYMGFREYCVGFHKPSLFGLLVLMIVIVIIKPLNCKQHGP